MPDNWKCSCCGVPTPGKRRVCACITDCLYDPKTMNRALKEGEIMRVIESTDGIRAYVEVECLPYRMKDGVERRGTCNIPVWRNPPKDGPAQRWQWDGDTSLPTVTPSYACQTCGLHITITKGVESGRPVPAPGHTDLMVTPESLDAFIAANPLPE